MLKKICFILTLFIINSEIVFSDMKKLITHHYGEQRIDLLSHREQLSAKTNLALPLDQEQALLNQLSEFALGRFLLSNKGLNGYWTSYIILHGPKDDKLDGLERWMLHKSPAIIATQERFQIFQLHLQKYLRNGMQIASIPCGLMDDLLGLDHSKIQDVKLVGIDLDTKSIELAEKNAEKYNIKNVLFINKDAWNLGVFQEYDIITSNGLNIYQPDDKKVIELYKEFYKALKPSGILNNPNYV